MDDINMIESGDWCFVEKLEIEYVESHLVGEQSSTTDRYFIINRVSLAMKVPIERRSLISKIDDCLKSDVIEWDTEGFSLEKAELDSCSSCSRQFSTITIEIEQSVIEADGYISRRRSRNSTFSLLVYAHKIMMNRSHYPVH